MIPPRTSGNANPAKCGEKQFAPPTRAPYRPQRRREHHFCGALDLKNGLCYTDETWAILLGTPTKASNSLTEVCTYLSAVKAAESDLQYGGEGQ